MSTCVVCAGTAFSPAGSASSTSCQCNAGYTGPNGGACTQCASGSYKDAAGPASCDSCPSGLNSPGAVSQHLLPVLLSLLCRWLHTPEGGPCEWCEEGRYKPIQGSEACSITLSQTGSDELTDCRCNSGYTGSDGGPCLACAPVKYKTVIVEDGEGGRDGEGRDLLATAVLGTRTLDRD